MHIKKLNSQVDECKDQLFRRHLIPRETKEKIVVQDILDSFQVFSRLEPYLQNPPRLKEQLLFQITDEIANELIEK